jgi:hypothetical protein
MGCSIARESCQFLAVSAWSIEIDRITGVVKKTEGFSIENQELIAKR